MQNVLEVRDAKYSPRPFRATPLSEGGCRRIYLPPPRGGCRRSRLGEYSELYQTIAPYMDTSATGNSAPKSRISFNARIQARENGLKSRWNFGLKVRKDKSSANVGCRRLSARAIEEDMSAGKKRD